MSCVDVTVEAEAQSRGCITSPPSAPSSTHDPPPPYHPHRLLHPLTAELEMPPMVSTPAEAVIDPIVSTVWPKVPPFWYLVSTGLDKTLTLTLVLT